MSSTMPCDMNAVVSGSSCKPDSQPAAELRMMSSICWKLVIRCGLEAVPSSAAVLVEFAVFTTSSSPDSEYTSGVVQQLQETAFEPAAAGRLLFADAETAPPPPLMMMMILTQCN
jgi:hypothetical protein